MERNNRSIYILNNLKWNFYMWVPDVNEGSTIEIAQNNQKMDFSLLNNSLYWVILLVILSGSLNGFT